MLLIAHFVSTKSHPVISNRLFGVLVLVYLSAEQLCQSMPLAKFCTAEFQDQLKHLELTRRQLACDMDVGARLILSLSGEKNAFNFYVVVVLGICFLIGGRNSETIS